MATTIKTKFSTGSKVYFLSGSGAEFKVQFGIVSNVYIAVHSEKTHIEYSITSPNSHGHSIEEKDMTENVKDLPKMVSSRLKELEKQMQVNYGK